MSMTVQEMRESVFAVISETRKLTEKYRKASLAPLDVLHNLGPRRSRALREAIGEIAEEATVLDAAIQEAQAWEPPAEAASVEVEPSDGGLPDETLTDLAAACGSSR